MTKGLVTRSSKIKSILKLCFNIYSEKQFCVRKSSSSLHMPSIMMAQKQRNESLENIRTAKKYRKAGKQEPKQTVKQKKHITKETKNMQCKVPCGLAKYQRTQTFSACHRGIRNNFSQSCVACVASVSVWFGSKE